MELNTQHFSRFKECFPEPPNQPAVGRNPQEYLQLLNEISGSEYEWPENHQNGAVTRSQLKNLCHDNGVDVLIAYSAVMAWGGANRDHYKSSISTYSINALERALKHLRTSKNDRAADFRILQTEAEHIKGLGISFYTKLLYFFRPKSDAYILDQFTAKSTQLLFSRPPVNLSYQRSPDPKTTQDQYNLFCKAVEHLSVLFSRDNPHWTPEKVEMAMFDQRGGVWRKYVNGHFPKPKKRQQIAKTSVLEHHMQTAANNDAQLEEFLSWLRRESRRTPTLGKSRGAHIKSIIQDDRLLITIESKQRVLSITLKTIASYVKLYSDYPKRKIDGQMRYVIALFLKFKHDQLA